MPKVDLAPLAKHEGALLSYLDINFRRISDTLESLGVVESGEFEVTGALEIDTGIANVVSVVATLASVPTSTGCFVRAYVVGPASPRNIMLEVFTDAFAYSTVAKDVQWLAVGNP